jgi:Arc/MetJ-type ribon-helix-helix transcriptional regulator
MTIELAKDVEEFLQKEVRENACSEPGDLVNELVRCLREQQRKSFEQSDELEAWLLEAADGFVSPLIPEDFERIRQRVRARRGSATA